MKIILAADHAGFRLKETIRQYLQEKGYEAEDIGTDSEEPVDYPDFIIPAAESVARGETQRGIVFGGSGNGEAMAANKVRGIRCALCWNVESARLARAHNNANMISLGGRMVSPEEGIAIVEAWLQGSFEEGRHRRRIEKIARYEEQV